MRDNDKRSTFGHVVEALDMLKPAYLCLLEPNEKDAGMEQVKHVLGTFRERNPMPVIGNTKFAETSGEMALKEGRADAIASGVPFLANSERPERLRYDASLNTRNPEPFYGGRRQGYTDYLSVAGKRGEGTLWSANFSKPRIRNSYRIKIALIASVQPSVFGNRLWQ